jgi:nucleotidyltransferase substrate binding protein (TIGR01987 family)
LIKSFEYTYELAWNTIKDFYEEQGEAGIQGSRAAIQLAFKIGLIRNGNTWMEMLKDCNCTSHTYNEQTAKEIAGNIVSNYFSCFIDLSATLEQIEQR